MSDPITEDLKDDRDELIDRLTAAEKEVERLRGEVAGRVNEIAELVSELEQRDAARAELARAREVVEAAKAWAMVYADTSADYLDGAELSLRTAIRAYLAAVETPAQDQTRDEMSAPTDRYMMATEAIHALADISRDEPDLAVIYGEDGDAYIGEWATGMGYVNVHFPKASTRELTDEERAYYSTKGIETAGMVRPIIFDASRDPAPDTDGMPDQPHEAVTE